MHEKAPNPIKIARSMSGLSREKFAEIFGFNTNTLYAWEIGKTQPTSENIKRLRKALIEAGLICTDEWLSSGEGRPPQYIGKNKELPSEINKENAILWEIAAFESINPEGYVTTITDDGMLPFYNPTDYVAGIMKTGHDINQLIQTHCIVETQQGEILTRKLLNGSKAGYYTLACVNYMTDLKPMITDIKLVFAAQIIWHRITNPQNINKDI